METIERAEGSVVAGEGVRASHLAPLVAALIVALPALLFPYPPASDLPYHEASVSILRHLHDASRFPGDVYVANLGHPNQLFHFAAWGLSHVMSTALAVRVVLALAMAGVPLGAAHLAKHVGAKPWGAVAIASLALGWLLVTGLVANMLGLALLLALLPALDGYVARPTARGAAIAIASVVVLYFAHEGAMFLYAGAACVITLGFPFRPRALGARLVPVLFAGVLAALQIVAQRALFTPATDRARTDFTPLVSKLSSLPIALYGAYEPALSRVLTASLAIVALALATQRWRELRAATAARPVGFTAIARAYRYEILAAACFAGYLAAPAHYNGATLVYHRFLAPAVAIGLIAASPREEARPSPLARVTPIVAALVPIATLFVMLPAFAESSATYEALERLMPHIAEGSAVAELGDPGPGVRGTQGYKTGGIQARVLSERGGQSIYSFSESPIAPVRLRPEYQWEEPIARLAKNGNALCPSYDFTRFRYLLFETPSVDRQLLVSSALEPEAKVAAVAGNWVLFESRLATVPLASPDGVPPTLCTKDNLGTRVAALSSARGSQP